MKEAPYADETVRVNDVPNTTGWFCSTTKNPENKTKVCAKPREREQGGCLQAGKLAIC